MKKAARRLAPSARSACAEFVHDHWGMLNCMAGIAGGAGRRGSSSTASSARAAGRWPRVFTRRCSSAPFVMFLDAAHGRPRLGRRGDDARDPRRARHALRHRRAWTSAARRTSAWWSASSTAASISAPPSRRSSSGSVLPARRQPARRAQLVDLAGRHGARRRVIGLALSPRVWNVFRPNPRRA